MDATEITNLLYIYAEHMDAGDFAGAAELFRHAEVILDPVNDVRVGEEGILAVWESMVRRYEDGTPHTKHVITNPIVTIDAEAGTANCRSYYTVIQQVDGVLTPIVAGRYNDDFERVDGAWRFSRRDYSLMDLPGDLSHHLMG